MKAEVGYVGHTVVLVVPPVGDIDCPPFAGGSAVIFLTHEEWSNVSMYFTILTFTYIF